MTLRSLQVFLFFSKTLQTLWSIFFESKTFFLLFVALFSYFSISCFYFLNIYFDFVKKKKNLVEKISREFKFTRAIERKQLYRRLVTSSRHHIYVVTVLISKVSNMYIVCVCENIIIEEEIKKYGVVGKWKISWQ